MKINLRVSPKQAGLIRDWALVAARLNQQVLTEASPGTIAYNVFAEDLKTVLEIIKIVNCQTTKSRA